MKKEIRQLALITLLLAVLTVGAILLQDGSLSMYQGTPWQLSSEEEVTVTLDESVARLESVRIRTGGVALRFVRCGEGSTECRIRFGGTAVNFVLRSGPLGVLVNEYSKDFSGWLFLLIAGSVWFLAAFLLFFRGYRDCLKKNVYSYECVNKLGLSLLFGMLALLGLILLGIRLIDPFSFGFHTILSALSMAMVYFAVFSAPVVLLFALALCISNIALIRRERFRPVNLLGILISLLMVLGLIGGIFMNELLMAWYVRTGRVVNSFRFTAILNSYYGFYAFFVCMLLAVFILFGYVRRHEPAYDKDFIVILGCRIRPDGSLYPLIRGRVDKALEFASKQEAAGGPKAIFIPSGGQGEGEPVAEAEAMAAYLREQGIPEERILIENRSRTTRENLRFSKALAEAAKPGGRAAFATTNYHVFRSGILAAKEGWKPEGMGSSTKWYFWPNAQIREFAGLLSENRRGILAFFLLILAQAAVLAALI